MSALPCLTNTRPNAPLFSVVAGGGGIPLNQDITCSTITVGEQAVISSLNAGLVVCSTLEASTIVNNDGLLNIGAANISLYSGLGVNILNAGGSGGALNVSTINVSSINGATPGGGGGPVGPDIVCSTLIASGQITCLGPQINLSSTTNLNFESAPGNESGSIFFQNAPGSGSATAMGYDTTTSSILITGFSVGGPAIPALMTVQAGITTSSLTVSSINGAAPGGGGSGLTTSSIGAAASFNSGPSSFYVVQDPSSPSPPTQFSEPFTLQANTMYQVAANLNYQFQEVGNSNVYMGMRLTNAPGQVVFSPAESLIGPLNVQGFAPSWTIATGASTLANVQMDLLLQFENNVINISSLITPPDPSGYSITLTTLGTH
jgi:hypothetical protein